MGKGRKRFTPTIMGEKEKSNGALFYETVSVPDFFLLFLREMMTLFCKDHFRNISLHLVHGELYD